MNIKSLGSNVVAGTQRMRAEGINRIRTIRTQVTPEIRSRIGQTIQKGVKNCFKIYTTFYILSGGPFSDICCMKTYRHGTDPIAAVNIILNGPDHSKAGTGEGGEARYFKLAKEKSSWAERDAKRQAFYIAEERAYLFKSINEYYIKPRIMAKHYAFQATASLVTSSLPVQNEVKRKLMCRVNNISNYLSPNPYLLIVPLPVIKFHMDTVNHMKFKFDYNCASYTKDKFSVFDIGIVGVLNNGIINDPRRLFLRIRRNPDQFMWGVDQIVVMMAVRQYIYRPAATVALLKKIIYV